MMKLFALSAFLSKYFLFKEAKSDLAYRSDGGSISVCVIWMQKSIRFSLLSFVIDLFVTTENFLLV